MKSRLIPWIALCSFTLSGCSEESQAAGKEALERAGQNLEEAGQNLAELMRLGRDAFTEKVEEQLTQLEARIEELRRRGGAEAEAAINRLEELRLAAHEKLGRLRDAGEDVWKDLREDLARSLEELQRKVEEQGTTGR